MLDKFDEASDALKAKAYNKVKAALDSGTEVVSKRIKVIKMDDKSDFGWSTVNEYFSGELASNSDDEERMYRAERRVERKPRKGVVVSVPRIERNRRLLLLPLFLPVQDLPTQRVVSLIEGLIALRSVWGLVLREVVFFTLRVRLALFSPSDLWCYSQAISNILQYLLAIFVPCFPINFW